MGIGEFFNRRLRTEQVSPKMPENAGPACECDVLEPIYLNQLKLNGKKIVIGVEQPIELNMREGKGNATVTIKHIGSHEFYNIFYAKPDDITYIPTSVSANKIGDPNLISSEQRIAYHLCISNSEPRDCNGQNLDYQKIRAKYLETLKIVKDHFAASAQATQH